MRRLLFLDGDRGVAYRCAGHRFHCEAVFAADEQGLAAYRAWLAQARGVPLVILVDAVDEAYHWDRLPPAARGDRRVLRRRAGERQLPVTPYRTVRPHRRDRHGEQVLVAGLRDPERWRPWCEPIDQLGIPLEAITSVPWLGERLLQHLDWDDAPEVLVVSQPGPTTLRQAYYQHGRLVFARLVPLAQAPPAEQGATFRQELDRVVDFLAAQQWRRAGQSLPVVAVVPPALHNPIETACSDLGNASMRLLAPETVARRTGIKGDPASPYADIVFAQLALRERPNHYAPPHLRRGLRTRRVRIGLWALAALLGAGAAVTALAGWWAERGYARAIARVHAQAERLQADYRERVAPLTPLGPSPNRVERVVDGMGELANTGVQHPGAAMAAVGDVLTGDHAAIELVALRVRYAATVSGEAVQNGGGAGAGSDDASAAAGVQLQGRVTGLEGDRWRAQRLVTALRDDLAAHPELTDVSIEAAPFGANALESVSGAQDREQAPFTLHLVREAPDGGI